MALTASIPTESRVPRKRRRGSALSRRTVLFALPAFAIYLFIVFVPSLQGAGYALTDWNGLSRGFSFVGLDNVASVLQNPSSARALANTLIIAGVYTIIVNTLGLLLALGVNSRIKSRNLLKVLIFAPAVMTPVVVAYLWQYMLAPNGPVNEALRGVGLGDLASVWLGEPSLALGSIIFVLVWQFAGYSMVIFIAGLQAVPQELLEAAEVDGAGRWRRFTSVVLPLLAPAITINLTLSMIGSLKVFDHVWVLTGGGPGGSTHTLTTLIFREAFTFGAYGKGVTLALLLLVIVAVISVFQYRTLARRELRH